MTYLPQGDTSVDSFQSYGRQAAAVMINGIRQLPAAQRAAALKLAMSVLDPTLTARAEKLAQQARDRGLPAAAALEAGLAQAMTDGVIGELARVGQGKRIKPGPGSLLGLGATLVGTTIGTTTSPAPLPAPRVEPIMMQVGPWKLPIKGSAEIIRESEMTQPQLQSLGEGILRAWRGLVVNGALMASVTPTFKIGVPVVTQLFTANPVMTGQVASAKGAFGDPRMAAFAAMKQVTTGDLPIIKFDHPTDKSEEYGVFIKLFGGELEAAPMWKIVTHERGWDGNVFGSIWSGIKKVAAAIIGVVEDVVDKVKDLTCKLVSNPNVAAGAAAGAATNPAVAAGVIVAGNTCGGAGGVPIAPPASSGMLLPLLLVGGGLLAVFALSER